MIEFLAKDPDARFRTYTNNLWSATASEDTAGPTRGEFAQEKCEAWLTGQAGSGPGTINQPLLDLYISIDPARAKAFLSNLVFDNIAPDGACSTMLMDALRAVDSESAPSAPSNNSTLPDFRRPVDSNYELAQSVPTVSGWAYVAATSIIRSVDAGAKLDTSLLAQLDTANPWAAGYARWYALNKQAPATLDATLLSGLNDYKPAAAAYLCQQVVNRQLATGKDPTLSYLNILEQTNLQAAAQASEAALRVQVRQGRDPAIGYLTILAKTNPASAAQICFDGLNLQVAAHRDPSLAYLNILKTVDLQSAAKFCLDALSAQLDAHRPLDAEYLKIFAEWNPVGAAGLIVKDFEDALQPTNRLAPSSDTGAADNVTDLARPAIRVDLEGMGVPGPRIGDKIQLWIDGGLAIEVDASTIGVAYGEQDIVPPADLAVGPHTIITTFSRANADGTPPTVSAPSVPLTIYVGKGPVGYAPLPARPLNLPAWTLLKTLDSPTADRWWTRFETAGLVTEKPVPPPPAVNPDDYSNLSPDELAKLDIETRLRAVFEARAARVEELLAAQVDVVEKKNEMLAKVSTVQTALNKLAALVPPDAKGDFNVSTVAGFAAARDEINAAIRAANIKPFSTTDGLMPSNVQYGPLKSSIEAAKGAAEGLSNNLQIDMLKLQSYTNRRNECYDLVSNFLQKMNSLRQNIVGNMRS